MEQKQELLTEVLRILQQNYKYMLEINRVTKELADTLSRGDKESASLLLKMRSEEMDKADENKRKIQTILTAVDLQTREELRGLLNREDKRNLQDFESKKIVEFSEKIQNVLRQTIETDRIVSRKLAGKDSYYQKK
jgi:hypothetical protein|nr:hypothetical protein [uncultured Faecalimonas sp.]